MNVLLIGGGGREHALAWKLSKSPLLTTLFCAPGNAGIAECASVIALDISDAGAVERFCREKSIDLVVIGPEAPLVAGLSDALRSAGVSVFGPSQAAAQLEASKAFTKALCQKNDIPTAAYGVFDNEADALAHLEDKGAPIVVKADGLAAGKGVAVCDTLDDARAAIAACFSGRFGGAGAKVVLEEKLTGEEMSFFALCDGQTAIPFGTARDYKRAFDRDTGPNTGGMGAVSPSPRETPALVDTVMARIIQPTLDGMVRRGTPFSGILFAGLMLTGEGPKLIEYNVRFGDPECQTLMLRLESDLLPILYRIARGGSVGDHAVNWSGQRSVAVVMASKGYPDTPATHPGVIELSPRPTNNVVIFHASTIRAQDGTLTTKGGRTLNVCGTGETYTHARMRAYETLSHIAWEGGFYRTDIGSHLT
jgi:phosphoribosylamine--glycine ligase